jgi:hypothetical protein
MEVTGLFQAPSHFIHGEETPSTQWIGYQPKLEMNKPYHYKDKQKLVQVGICPKEEHNRI